MIEGFKHLEYSARLEKLKLPSLVYRRARGRMIEVWRHFHAHDNAVARPMFELVISQRYPLKIRRGPVQYKYKQVQANFFYHFAPLGWNLLSSDTRTSENMDTFKARLDREWKNSPILYNYDKLATHVNSRREA